MFCFGPHRPLPCDNVQGLEKGCKGRRAECPAAYLGQVVKQWTLGKCKDSESLFLYDPDTYEKPVPTLPGAWLGGLEVQGSLGVGPRCESGFRPHPRHLRSHVRDSSHLSPALDGDPGLALCSLVPAGGISEPVGQLLDDVVLGALQRQGPGPGQEASVACLGIATGGAAHQGSPQVSTEGHPQRPPAGKERDGAVRAEDQQAGGGARSPALPRPSCQPCPGL